MVNFFKEMFSLKYKYSCKVFTQPRLTRCVQNQVGHESMTVTVTLTMIMTMTMTMI